MFKTHFEQNFCNHQYQTDSVQRESLPFLSEPLSPPQTHVVLAHTLRPVSNTQRLEGAHGDASAQRTASSDI